ncbi:MAG: response regulator [Candidatus Eremiobacterota bacterium]
MLNSVREKGFSKIFMAKILIIDDDDGVRKIVTHRLKKNNHETYPFSNGVEALRQIKEINPDLIILDVVMPVMTGYEVLQHLQKDRELQTIPVMMLTAQDQLQDKIKGLDYGAYDYLAKPFDHQELSVRAEALLRLRSLQLQLIKAERLAVVGHVALTVKKEMEKPLKSIVKLSESLVDKEIPSDIKKKITHILDSTLRIARIIQKLEGLQDTPVKDYLSGIKMIDLGKE